VTAEGAAPAPPPETPWRRLSARMLLVHPVQEVVRAMPALVGLVVAGSGSGQGGRWALIGVALAIAAGTLRWFTTRYRVTPEQVQVRRGLLRRSLRAVSRDRVRTIDVSANPLQRVLGLVRLTVGTGLAERGPRGGGVRLDGLDARDATGLRDALLHDRPRGAAPGADQTAPEEVAAETELARLRPAWLAYAPFTLSGVLTVGAIGGFLINTADDLHLDPRHLGIVHRAGDVLGGAPLVLAIVVALLAVALLVAVCSTAGYALAFWGYRLTRHPSGTLHVTRGLLSTRATTIEERRLRGVELTQPLLLRGAGGARCDAIATGLGAGRGAERGTTLFPPGPRAVAARVAADVLRTTEPVTVPLTPHGPRARVRRFTRALSGSAVIVAAAAAGAIAGIWPDTVWEVALVTVPLAAALAADRARSLGHAVTPTALVARAGSLVRRRAMLSREGIIGITLRRSFFQRRAGLCTLTATTAAGRQAYAVLDVADDEALRVCDAAVPGLLDVFRGESG
jgi:putative membrane protein